MCSYKYVLPSVVHGKPALVAVILKVLLALENTFLKGLQRNIAIPQLRDDVKLELQAYWMLLYA